MPSSCMRRFSSWWPPACRSGGGSSKGPCRGTPSAGSTPSSGLFSPHTQSSCGGDCSTKNRDRSGDPESRRRQTSNSQTSEQSRDEEEKLAEYNRYLADLHASDESRPEPIPVHGVMHIVYLASAVDLARRGQLVTRQLAIIALAGFVPFLAFSSSNAGSAGQVRHVIRDGSILDGPDG